MEKFENLSKEELLELIRKMREVLATCENADDFCFYVADTFDVYLGEGV